MCYITLYPGDVHNSPMSSNEIARFWRRPSSVLVSYQSGNAAPALMNDALAVRQTRSL
jgi:hypothetical protein